MKYYHQICNCRAIWITGHSNGSIVRQMALKRFGFRIPLHS